MSSGRKVFLDLKFHDIPNTVAGAVRSAAELGVSDAHGPRLGGSKMLQGCRGALRRNRPRNRWFWPLPY